MNAEKIPMEQINHFFDGYIRSESDAENAIIIKRVYLEMTGNLTEAALLTQIMYWHGIGKDGQCRLRVQDNEGLWLAKTYADWLQECGVKTATARKAIERLQNKGLIRTKTGRFNDRNTLLIQINREGFYTCYMKIQSDKKGHFQSDKIYHSKVIKKDTSYIQETLTENTLTDSLLPPTTQPDTEQVQVGGSEKILPLPEQKIIAILQEKWLDPYLMGQTIDGRIESLRSEMQYIPPPPVPRPKTGYQTLKQDASNQAVYEAFSFYLKIVKHLGSYSKSEWALYKPVLRWLWLEAYASYKDILDFAAWYHKTHPTLSFVKKLEGENGKKGWKQFWQDWLEDRPMTIDEVMAKHGKVS